MSDVAIETEKPLVIGRLKVGSIGHHANGWWGMIMLIITEAFLFFYLLFSYYYFAIQSDGTFLPDEMPSFKFSGPETGVLLLASLAVWFGERGGRKGSRLQLVLGLLLALALGCGFVAIELFEWMDKTFTLASNAYGSSFFTVTGFHLAHVVAGLLMLLPLTFWSALGYFDRERIVPVTIVMMYWFFIDVIWLMVFFTFYVTPYFR
ncbi:cytochrome c oxidase subunit 3 [Aurantimonas sp. VKM B-3413]|uniref:cytochrome c oxidase subunit 3 n=1 Tax=Aurantimonas sp. VKM B-3413 TaxID=2779401 RepID=UPI001E4EEFA3|nr:cytochrome c oxidase subunit 3 [Aurantimonas sp. VKM B-3413]MCB8837144.1 cytochrome c oxidase subunit 3 [Aurantimonas sp. VKM B-3413]